MIYDFEIGSYEESKIVNHKLQFLFDFEYVAMFETQQVKYCLYRGKRG